MIEINDKVNCSGCTACYAVCPQSAIEMKLDEEGFKYPRVDKNRCVECGLCNSVCPILNKRKIGEETTSGYIVQNKNDSIRLKSTSRGGYKCNCRICYFMRWSRIWLRVFG